MITNYSLRIEEERNHYTCASLIAFLLTDMLEDGTKLLLFVRDDSRCG